MERPRLVVSSIRANRIIVMTPHESSGPASTGQRSRSALCRMTLIVFCSGAPGLASAGSDSGFTEIVPAPPVIIEQRRGERRTELRQALIGSADLSQGASERQRISRDQSEALNRELREALRGVYEERGRGPR